MSTAALADYRKARAVELALAGASYDEVAKGIGLANRGTAWRYVNRALRERRFAAVDAYREAELERLQHIEDRLWPRAMGGDIEATREVRGVITQRILLLGLEATTEGNCTCAPCPQHGRNGQWWPTLTPEQAEDVQEPGKELVVDIETQLEGWVDQCGLWEVFQVLAAVGQAMQLAGLGRGSRL